MLIVFQNLWVISIRILKSSVNIALQDSSSDPLRMLAPFKEQERRLGFTLSIVGIFIICYIDTFNFLVRIQTERLLLSLNLLRKSSCCFDISVMLQKLQYLNVRLAA